MHLSERERAGLSPYNEDESQTSRPGPLSQSSNISCVRLLLPTVHALPRRSPPGPSRTRCPPPVSQPCHSKGRNHGRGAGPGLNFRKKQKPWSCSEASLQARRSQTNFPNLTNSILVSQRYSIVVPDPSTARAHACDWDISAFDGGDTICSSLHDLPRPRYGTVISQMSHHEGASRALLIWLGRTPTTTTLLSSNDPGSHRYTASIHHNREPWRNRVEAALFEYSRPGMKKQLVQRRWGCMPMK
nr:hypothetical protein CFP56_54962 [Quercus suber]